MYITESPHKGASSVEAGTAAGRGSSPAAPASHTRPGEWVLRASMNAETGMNDAMPLHAWSPSSKNPAITEIMSSSIV